MGRPGGDQTQAQRARTRALVIPREHGAWGLVLVPLISGAAVGWTAGHRIVPVLLFAIAVVALFWMRTPVESLLGTTPMSAQSPAERRIAFLAVAILGLSATACLFLLMWGGKNLGLLLLGTIAALAFLLQTLLKKLGRSWRMSAQLVGALGLTSTAASAYYIAAGHFGHSALGLWAANWIFAGNQIQFVHLQIHGARAATFPQKLAEGRWFLLGQILLTAVLFVTALAHFVPIWSGVVFLPMLARGFYWFLRKSAPLQIKQLGWSEMAQGVFFGILLTTVYICFP